MKDMLPGFPLEFEVLPPEILDKFESLTVSQHRPPITRKAIPEMQSTRLRRKIFDVSPSKSEMGIERETKTSSPQHLQDGLKLLKRSQYLTSKLSNFRNVRRIYNGLPKIDSLEGLVNHNRWEQAMNSSKRQVDGRHRIHFLFFGDSNIRNQHNFSVNMWPNPQS
jgi:hypothetical protein